MNIEYPIHLYLNTNGRTPHWVAEYLDLPGCIGVGDSKFEAIEEAEIFKEMWLSHANEEGKGIPIPSDSLIKEYSGKFNLRVSRSLHRRLSLKAEHEQVSMNTLCANYLERSLALECPSIFTLRKEELSYDCKPLSKDKSMLRVHDKDDSIL